MLDTHVHSRARIYYVCAACFVLLMILCGKHTSICVCYAAATMVLVDITRARARDANYLGQRVHAKHLHDPEVKISASSLSVLSFAASGCAFHSITQ
jgi:hypothetical protein